MTVITDGGGVFCSAVAVALAMNEASVAILDVSEDAALKVVSKIKGKPWKAYGFWAHIGFVETEKRTDLDGLKYVELIKSLQGPK